MTRARTLLERLRHTFWVMPAVGIAVGLALGFGISSVDDSLDPPQPIAFNGDADTARSLLQAIIGLTVSIAGISFSVIVIALVLASQQLSPRVLRSFQRNPLNQAVLGVLLGTAAFAVAVLSAIGDDRAEPVPNFSISLSILLAAASLTLFVFFLHHMLRSLNASAVIRRIAAEGHQAVEAPYPSRAGAEPEDELAAETEFERRTRELDHVEVTAPRAGYLATVKATELLDRARRDDAMIAQAAVIGDFVVTGASLATVWASEERVEAVASAAGDAFVLNEERIVDHDVAFPIRQLADVALKGLSPSVNDPTTSENAMDSLTDTLVRVARNDSASPIRLDRDGAPRLKTVRPRLDDLIRLGFDQVRRDGARRPSFAVRLLELLADIRRLGGRAAANSRELERQAEVIAQTSEREAASEDDRAMIRDAYQTLHSRGAGRGA